MKSLMFEREEEREENQVKITEKGREGWRGSEEKVSTHLIRGLIMEEEEDKGIIIPPSPDDTAN